MSGEVSTHPSLCPPSHGYSPSDAPAASWVLLDLHAYIADRKNATSAYGKMSNGKAIQVTFCTAPPPLVSYICVWCPDLPPTELTTPPTIEAAEADRVLFRVSLRRDRYRSDYFVYEASGSNGPSLRRIDDLGRHMPYRYSTALLSRRDLGEGVHIVPSTDDDIAVLNHDLQKLSILNLCIYNSLEKVWRIRAVSPASHHVHFTSKVINLGEHGLLGFVDPWRGILFCDISCKSVHYLPLPPHLIESVKTNNEPLLFRDVALVEGNLTLAELHPSTELDSHTKNKNCNWSLSTWSISSPWKGQDDWRMEYTLEFRHVVVDTNTDNSDLLAKLPANGETSQRSLGRLLLAHPILSLSDKRVVFLMGKFSIRDKKALVLSVDMENSRVQGATVFDAERMIGIGFGYTCIQSTISSYFNMASGTSYVEAGIEKAVRPKKRKKSRDKVIPVEDSIQKLEEQRAPNGIENSCFSAGIQNAEFEVEEAVNVKKQKANVVEAVHMRQITNKVQKQSSTKKIERNSSSCSKDEQESEADRTAKHSTKDGDEIYEPAKIPKKQPKVPETNQSQASGCNIVFVGNLSFNVEYEEVKCFFEKVGDVEDIRFATTFDGNFKGFAHVKFTTAEAATKALEFSGRLLMGRPLRVELAHERAFCAPNSGMDNMYAKKHQRSVNTLFIAGFNTCLEDKQIRDSLKQHFGSCGDITRISIPINYVTGASKGIAFMDFRDQGSMSKAFRLNGSDLGGFKLRVAEAKPRPGNGGGLSQRHGGNTEGRGISHGHYVARGHSIGGQMLAQGKKITFLDDD